jgi:hypothetical protein
MKANKLLVTVLVTVPFFIDSPATYGAGLINGDFEIPVVPLGYGGYTGNPPLPGFGWQVGSGNIDLVRTLWQPASGAQSIDLNGDQMPFGQHGSIYQDFTFPQSGVWQVAFAMSVNPDSPDPRSMRVSFGETGGGIYTLGNYSLQRGTRTYSNMQWIEVTTPVISVLEGVLYRLDFNSLESYTDWGIALDNIRLIQVPEPGTGALLLSAAVLVAGVRRRNA